ncbi:MAG: AAA family ATPase, partial [Erysipelotrichaceae bacterium]|nr:AAA family ATPase [Erysipelotrichaceae bacterium]
MNKVIAIVGMCGSGKSIASDILEKKGYEKVYFGGVTLDKLKENGLEINPENEKMMREKLRENLGMGAFAKILLPKIKELAKAKDVVLDGLYS